MFIILIQVLIFIHEILIFIYETTSILVIVHRNRSNNDGNNRQDLCVILTKTLVFSIVNGIYLIFLNLIGRNGIYCYIIGDDTYKLISNILLCIY